MGNYTCVMLLLLCFVFLLVSPTFGKDNLLFKLSSRDDEFVQMAGYGEEKLSTVLVTGSVICEASFDSGGGGGQPHAWPIPGVSVAVKCHSHATKRKGHSHATKRKGKSMLARGVTDEFGDFIVDLPSHLHAIPNLEKICRVKILRIPKGSPCWPAHAKRHKGLKLISFENGTRIYNAGNIAFRHSTSAPQHAAVQMG